MKRLSTLLIPLVVVALAGCGGQQARQEKEAQGSAAGQPAATSEHSASASQTSQAQETASPPAAQKAPAAPTPTTDAQTKTLPSGLKYVDLVEGTGPSPQHGQICVVHYTGWFTNGQKFDSSLDRGQPYSFPLGMGRVIKGWDEGVQSMKVGGKRKLIVPYQLAYGEAGRPPLIPPKSDLIFEVQLLQIK